MAVKIFGPIKDHPEGVAAGPIAWPAPERHVTGPVVSFGYEGEVVLTAPLRVGPDWPAAATVERPAPQAIRVIMFLSRGRLPPGR